MGDWVGPVVIRAISPRVLLGMATAKPDCGPMWTNGPLPVVKTVLVITVAGPVTMSSPFPQLSQKELQDKNVHDDDSGSFFTLWQR